MEIAIKDYIEQSIPELKDRIFPVMTLDISRISVAYKFTPLSGGHVRESQVELKIIDKDYDLCKAIEKKITALLDMEEDKPFIIFDGIRFHSKLAGGGTLLNDGCQCYEDTLYFIIDWRKLNE